MLLLSLAKTGTYTCGGIALPAMLPYLVNLAVTIIKIGVPVLLIILGMIDMGKAVIAQKEDEIKKAQGMFVKRLVAAALVFFIFVITELVVGIVASDTDKTNITNYLDLFINGNAESSGCTYN